MRDAFGNLICSPAVLPREQRIDALLGLAGRLLADAKPDARWLGAALRDALIDGTDLPRRLGITAPRGARSTPQRILERRAQGAALLRLSVAAGGDAAARRILAGAECPARCQAALDEAIALGCPGSKNAFRRARAKAPRHRP
jgi:hypothetical protein